MYAYKENGKTVHVIIMKNGKFVQKCKNEN